ncbi:ATP-grasp domain-containing protein [Photobacterium sp. CCB-ST2H9]|uniref:ATP-grasp domain-containing protein n=1 Tax=Photobacterium sp. CCB-ST2H9 TaxID=2912855 RepID=UPI0020043C91|nr:ATP-grasp domain-containing protein [Photobacterium sp. CCB-ST2H9]UTM56558.1 ATP-grasp domain-containing protein [Photobacterium sp. CCB-ST2H9]
MNILLTSVGRRGYIVDYFKETFVEERKVYTANSELTYTMKLADGYLITPLIYEDNYIDVIINFCKEKDISIIISLFDIDLYILAKNEERFSENGIQLILAPEKSIEICNDKWLTYQFLMEVKVNTPKTYISLDSVINAIEIGEIEYPVILKPRWGMASMGIYIADNEEELRVLYNKSYKDIFNSYLKFESTLTRDKPIIIQQYLKGNEFGLDVINDLSNKFVTCLAKQKVRMRAGETDLGLTVANTEFLSVSKVLSEKIKHKGILSVDAFVVNDVVYVTEMNCRISGHYPISHAVGFNYPELLRSWLNESDLDSKYLSFEENVYVCKELSIKRL